MKREKRVFAASQKVINKRTELAVKRMVSGMRRQIGASQAQIMQGRDVASNQAWISELDSQIGRIQKGR